MNKAKCKQTEVYGGRNSGQGEGRSRTIGEIPEGWELRELGSLGQVVTGKTPPTKDSNNFGLGYPFITPRDMHGQKYLLSTERSLTEKGKGVVRNCLLSVDSVCVSCIGSDMGKVVMTDRQSITNQQQGKSEQRAIAKIFSDLDEKIELNHQMNKTLESIAQAIFKRWLVDLEFPGYEKTEFVNGLPKGWSEGKLIDVCDIVMGQSPPGETYNESGDGVVFYQGNRDFGFRFPTPRVYCTAPTRLAETGDVLISVRAPVGALNITLGQCAVGRGVAALRMKHYSNGFLFYFLSTRKDLWERFNSEGTVFGCLNKTEFQKVNLIIPSDTVMQKFDTIIKSIEGIIQNNELENRALDKIRDSLLPRLMTGKIKVNICAKEN